MSTIDVARRYLAQSHSSIIVLSSGDILADNILYSPRRLRGNTIWISERKLKQLKKSSGIVLVVSGDTIREIPASKIPNNGGLVESIEVKVVDSSKSRIKISRELKNELEVISKDPESAIRVLLATYKKLMEVHPLNQSNVLLAVMGAINALKNPRYMDLVSKIDERREINVYELNDDERSILHELVRARVAFVDSRYDGDYARLVCKFALQELDDEYIIVRVGFSYDFCKLYCNRFDLCNIRKEDKENYYGFSIQFSKSEFEEKKAEELVETWLVRCAQSL